jgi:hypothetical protein
VPSKHLSHCRHSITHLHVHWRLSDETDWFFDSLCGEQARLTLPVLLVTLAVTPPFLLRSVPVEGASLTPQEARRGYSTPVWQVNCTPTYLPTNMPIHGTSCHKYPLIVNYCVNIIALSAGLPGVTCQAAASSTIYFVELHSHSNGQALCSKHAESRSMLRTKQGNRH